MRVCVGFACLCFHLGSSATSLVGAAFHATSSALSLTPSLPPLPLFAHVQTYTHPYRHTYIHTYIHTHHSNATHSTHEETSRHFVDLQYGKAEELYRRAISVAPTDVSLVYDFAVFLQERKRDYDAAEAEYKKAMAMAPDDGNVLNNYAVFLHQCRNDTTGAEAIFKRAVAASPNASTTLCNYASFLESSMGRIDEAHDLYKLSLEYNVSPPSFPLFPCANAVRRHRGRKFCLTRSHPLTADPEPTPPCMSPASRGTARLSTTMPCSWINTWGTLRGQRPCTRGASSWTPRTRTL